MKSHVGNFQTCANWCHCSKPRLEFLLCLEFLNIFRFDPVLQFVLQENDTCVPSEETDYNDGLVGIPVTHRIT